MTQTAPKKFVSHTILMTRDCGLETCVITGLHTSFQKNSQYEIKIISVFSLWNSKWDVIVIDGFYHRMF